MEEGREGSTEVHGGRVGVKGKRVPYCLWVDEGRDCSSQDHAGCVEGVKEYERRKRRDYRSSHVPKSKGWGNS